MATRYTPTVTGTGVKATIQRFGGYLAGMVMPNIGAFIAWGLITALFIPTGWLPNKHLGAARRPDDHGPAAGAHRLHRRPAWSTASAAPWSARSPPWASSSARDIPMFLGAMIMGPLAAFMLKHVRQASSRTGSRPASRC